MGPGKRRVVLSALSLLLWLFAAAGAQECTVDGNPAACYPPYEDNIAAGTVPEATNTCGLDGPERFCEPGALGPICEQYCDASNASRAHLPEHITDDSSATFWQSQNITIVQYPNSVNITFSFNRTFEIRNINVTFQSLRPESFTILKSTDFGDTYTPFHYFSLSCNTTYGVEESTAVEAGNEAVPLCTSDGAQFLPFSGGEAVFLPLQHRPSAENFESVPELREWVTATNIRLRLDRLSTREDATPEALDSYYYAISNVEIGARCACNGHASACSEDLLCQCEHNTAGADCEECLPSHTLQPWGPATPDNPSICEACNCHPNGSLSVGCEGGVCQCRAEATGNRCDVCQDGFHVLSQGCIPCPSCYARVAVEFNLTVSLYQELLATLNMTVGGGLSPELLRRIQRYLLLLTELQERVQNLTERESQLFMEVDVIFLETQNLSIQIGQFAASISNLEATTVTLASRSNATADLLEELERLVAMLERTLANQIQRDVDEAQRLLSELQNEFSQLVQLATMANSTSHEQEALAQSLLEQAMGALSDAGEALDLLCQAIVLQNETTAVVEQLDQVRLPEIEGIFAMACEAFGMAERDVPLALNQSRMALERIQDLLIPDYGVESLQNEVDTLQNRTETVLVSQAIIDSRLEELRINFTSLNVTAQLLLQQSRDLTFEASELLILAHAALEVANAAVNQATADHNRAVSVLEQLMAQLRDISNFTDELAEVIRNIEMAELLSAMAEEEAQTKAGELREAIQVANTATQLLEMAVEDLLQAMMLAQGANATAAMTLTNATALNTSANNLFSEARSAESAVDILERAVNTDQTDIAAANSSARAAIASATSLQPRISQLQLVLANLSEELNTTVLISRERLEEASTTVSGFEQETDENQEMVDEVRGRVGELQASAAELRVQYENLLRHRDLLREILGNIEELDCLSQVQGAGA